MTVARLWFADKMKFGRSCRSCRELQYDEETGRPSPDRRFPGKNLPMYRPRSADPPCHGCAKTMGMPARERHWRHVSDPPPWVYATFRHWQMMEATRWSSPAARDPIVCQNAAVFATVRESVDEGRRAGLLAALSAAATKRHGRE